MTSPAKIASKGSTLSFGASGSLVALAQLLSIDVDGIETKEFDGTTLDNATGEEIGIPTGYYSPGTISGEGFFDATAMAGITGFPTASPIVAASASVTLGSGAVALVTASVISSVKYGVKVAMNDGVKINFELKRSG